MKEGSNKFKPLEERNINIISIDQSQEFLDFSKQNLEKKSNNMFNIDSFTSTDDILKLNLDNYDVILSGYNIKPLNGLELLSKIRNEINSSIPFIFFTKMDKEDIAIKALNLGANYYIRKRHDSNVQFIELYQIIKEIVLKNRLETALRANESKYRYLFEEAPISLWEQDWSKLKNKFIEFRRMGIKTGSELKNYFLNHPELIMHYVQLIEVVDVNKVTMEIYHIPNKNAILGPYTRLLTADSEAIFINEVATFFDGKTKFEMILETKTISGDEMSFHYSSTIPEGFEDSLSRVIILIIDLTEKKRAEEKNRLKEEQLLLSEARTKAILDLIPDLIFEMNDKGIIFSYYGSGDKYFFKPFQFLGKNINEILPEVSDLYLQIISLTLTKSKPQTFEYSYFLENELKFFNAKMVGMSTSKVLVIVRDITQQKRIDNILREKEITEQKLVQLELSRELRQKEHKFQVLVQNAPNIIITTDLEGIISFCNDDFLNKSKDQIIGKSIMDLFNPLDEKRIINYINQIIVTGETVSFETEGLSDFDNTWFHINLGALKEDFKVSSLIFIVTDITKEKETEKKLLLQSEEIKSINKELREFAYVVSHDLKSPLQVVESMIEFLFNNITKIEKLDLQNYLLQISKRINSMEQLINGILEYSNIGIYEEAKEVFKVNDLLDEIILILDPKKNFKFTVSENLPSFNFNKTRIYQLFHFKCNKI